MATTQQEQQDVAPAQVRSSRRVRFGDRDGALAWIFLMPSVVYIVGLVAVPFFLAIGFAFSDVSAGDPSYDFVGLRNYRRAFDDPVFWTSLRNTFVITIITMILVVVLGTVLSNILVAHFRGKWVVRFLILLAWTTPVSLSSVTWLWLLDSIYSPVDWVMREVGLLGPDGLFGPAQDMYWLGKPGLATASVIMVQTWRLVPLAAVIIMAGLAAIPDDLDEAARVDGAGFWRRMFEITTPLIMPVIAVATLFAAIFTFTDMAVVYVLTRGGPTDSTQVLASWAYYKGIEGGDIAQGAAIALFLFPILLAAAVAILRSVRKVEVL